MAKFNKGDKVRVKTIDGYNNLKAEFFEVGGIYEVKGCIEGLAGGNVYFGEYGDMSMTLLGDDLELVTEANAMTTFKKGDVVVTVKKAGYAKYGQGVHYAGAIGKVKSVNDGLLTVKFDKQQPNNRVPKQFRKNFVIELSEVRLATADEAASIAKKKAEKPTFKVGDKVRMLSDSLYGKKYKGKTGVVVEEAGEDGDISVTPDGGGTSGLFKADSLELLTETASVIPQVGDVVTFEGFDGEYRKVDRTAQAGDVVILKSGVKVTPWLTLGKAYGVSYANGEARIYGDDGDRIVLYRDEYDYNRTPETVDVFEKVEAQYVPQEGDIVVITGNLCGSRNAVGDIGKITKVKGYGVDVEVPSKPKTPRVNGNAHPNDGIRKATPAEVEAYEKAVHKASFSVGDYVKIVKSYDGQSEGDIVKITEIGAFKSDKGICDFIIEDIPVKRPGKFGVKAEQIVKATEQEVAYASKPKFKVGDSVVFESDAMMSGVTIGKVYVAKVDRDGDLYVTNERGASKCFAMTSGSLYGKPRHATAEEIAQTTKPKLKAGDFVKITDGTRSIVDGKVYEVFERSFGLYIVDNDGDERVFPLVGGLVKYEIIPADDAKWAKIGRKVGEYKVGDVVRITANNYEHKVGELRTIEAFGGAGFDFRFVNGGLSNYENIELVAPVESLFNA